MSSSYTHTDAESFTLTNAKYLASKVQADLLRMHRFYYASHREPTLDQIQEFHDELVLLQIHNYLWEIEYGFADGSTWIKALKYTARDGGVLTADEDPGGISFTQVSSNASFASMLRYNSKWHAASYHEQQSFRDKSPVTRTPGNGYSGDFQQQRAYSSGGRGLLRSGI